MLVLMPGRVAKLVRSGQSLVRVAQALGRDLYGLAKLEARLAASAAAMIAGLGVGTLVLGLTAWLLIVLSLVAWIADTFLSLPAALLSVGVLMLMLAAPMAFMATRLSRRLGFPETRRRLDEVLRGE